MDHAYQLAQRALYEQEVPIGACVLDEHGRMIGEGWNQVIQCHDPTAHAEIQALRKAAAHQQNYRLTRCTLVVTLEPCLMCYQAAVHARISTIIYGAEDTKVGVRSNDSVLQLPFNHKIVWEGPTDADRCGNLLRFFFQERRR